MTGYGKPFQCEHCGKRFVDGYALAQHISGKHLMFHKLALVIVACIAAFGAGVYFSMPSPDAMTAINYTKGP